MREGGEEGGESGGRVRGATQENEGRGTQLKAYWGRREAEEGGRQGAGGMVTGATTLCVAVWTD